MNVVFLPFCLLQLSAIGLFLKVVNREKSQWVNSSFQVLLFHDSGCWINDRSDACWICQAAVRCHRQSIARLSNVLLRCNAKPETTGDLSNPCGDHGVLPSGYVPINAVHALHYAIGRIQNALYITPAASETWSSCISGLSLCWQIDD